MSASKTLKDARGILEPLGFEYEGVNGNEHFVFRHEQSGAVVPVGQNSFKGHGRGRLNLEAQAAQKVRLAHSVSQQWVRWLLEQYEIGDHESNVVEIKIDQMVARFKAEHPEVRVSNKLWTIALRQSPYAQLVRKGQGGSPSLYALRGPLFGVKEDADVLGADREPDREPAADRVPEPDTVPAGGGEAQPVAGAEADDAAGGDDSVADEPDRPDRELSGLVLPQKVADELRDLLGAGGDLEAENELLRETLTTVLQSLQSGVQAVETALSLHTGPRLHAQKRRGYRLGRKRTQQLHALQAAGLRGELPAQITSQEVIDVLGVDYREALGILWALGRTGHMNRVARGVYEWSAQ